MIFDTSVKDKKVKKEIDNLVGKPFHILDIIKMGTIGSSRMEVLEYSKLFTKVMTWDKQKVQASIALRPEGILVILNVRLSNYSWVIPYRYLSIFKTEVLTIHSQGEFLKLKYSPYQNDKFVDKIIKLKNENSPNKDYFGDDFK